MAKIYCYHGSVADAVMGVETLLSKSPGLTPPPSREALGSEMEGEAVPLLITVLKRVSLLIHNRNFKENYVKDCICILHFEELTPRRHV